MRSALVTFDHMQEFQKLNNPTNPQLSFIQLYDNLLKAAQPQDLVDAEAKTKQQMDRKVNTTTQERVKPISYYVQHPWTAHPNWRTLSKKDCDKVNQACSKTTKPVDFKGSGGCGGCDRCTATVAAALTTQQQLPHLPSYQSPSQPVMYLIHLLSSWQCQQLKLQAP
jgi:hypothetical protein